MAKKKSAFELENEYKKARDLYIVVAAELDAKQAEFAKAREDYLSKATYLANQVFPGP